MEIREYYRQVFPRLARGFEGSHYVLGYGQELIAYGWDPNALLVTVEPVDRLWDLTVTKGLEVFIPVIGKDSDSVLLPFDFEIHLADFKRLYACPESQLWFFRRNIDPLQAHLCGEFLSRKIPFVLDYTPSGGHLLTRVRRGGLAWESLTRAGYLDESVLPGYSYHDPSDLKRNPAIKLDAALVFSGLGFLAEYLALRALQQLDGQTDLSLALWDAQPSCLNLDLSWTADPGYMRIIRAPFSAHKKRSQKFRFGPDPLVDVMGRYYDTVSDIRVEDFPAIIGCMWNLEQALQHATSFSGSIPCADDGLDALVQDYLRSPLKRFHDECHRGAADLAPAEALSRALDDAKLSSETRNIVRHPSPRMLQPSVMHDFVADLFLHGWHPRHIMNVIAARYEQGQHRWGIDFLKYNPVLKAWAFVRQYSAQAQIRHGGWTV